MNREVVRSEYRSIKVGVIDSAVASVRTQVEDQVAIRIMDGGCIGMASVCGRADMDVLTAAAKASLVFGIPYPVEPEYDASVAVEHAGQHRTAEELVAITDGVLDGLRSEFPDFSFSHGVEQQDLAWHIESSTGLDLHYRRVTTQIALVAKQKGSGNIVDTVVGVEGPTVNVEGALDAIRVHLTAFRAPARSVRGRQRVVFAGVEGMAGEGLFQLFRSDLTARTYASGTSLFDGRVGDGQAYFNPAFGLFEWRDHRTGRVCPFDMEGSLRDPLNLDIISRGTLQSLAASKRDAARYGVSATGTAIGGVGSLPSSGFGRLGVVPTADTLADLLDSDGALLVWFVAGGDATRMGDIALPVAVALALDPLGRPVGRVANCTLTGNLFDIFGGDYVGTTRAAIDPFSDEPFVVTHMTARP